MYFAVTFCVLFFMKKNLFSHFLFYYLRSILNTLLNSFATFVPYYIITRKAVNEVVVPLSVLVVCLVTVTREEVVTRPIFLELSKTIIYLRAELFEVDCWFCCRGLNLIVKTIKYSIPRTSASKIM